MILADIDLTPWSAGATIAASVMVILTGVGAGLVWLGRVINARIQEQALRSDKRFDKQDDESATFRTEIQAVVDELRATDRNHDTRITRVETRLDEHDKAHARLRSDA